MTRPVVAVVGFPGSNGDHDALHSLAEDVGVDARLVDYRQTSLAGVDAVVLPGGFSYGDSLRAGAIARFAPIMAAVRDFADEGGPILGICNGFQILTEAHLLPGALLRNKTLKFHCHLTHVRVEHATDFWTADCNPGEVLTLPVAHGEGQYFVDADTLGELEAHGQIALRYAERDGTLSDEANHNGSTAAIAGVANRGGNVLGLMPHPERATSPLVGATDGLKILGTLQELSAGLQTRAS